MSNPQTAEEQRRAELTLTAACDGEQLVSTACPACGTRFAMLARYCLKREASASLAGSQLQFAARGAWELRCMNCGHTCGGERK